MSRLPTLVTLLALAAAGWVVEAPAAKSTVCTITINSADEKDAFRRYLPKDKFEVVELVEPGNRDWLASACQRNIQCDVLVISGHFGGAQVAATEFYSAEVGGTEFLPVEEMERASCSESCPGLFSQLKEVYLFGCETLSPAASHATSDEIARTLVQAGRTPQDAAHIASVLNARHGETNRDRMRRIFAGVPVIYGFSSIAPLGPAAASTLSRYFQSASGSDVGNGQVSQNLLSNFTANSMTVTNGLSDSDPQAAYRADVCQFFDDRLAPAQKLAFVHGLLHRDIMEVRMFFERIDAFLASLTDEERQSPAFVETLTTIARDPAARERYMAFARSAEPPIRTRMIQVAQTLGWLTPAEQHAEITRMINELLTADTMGFGEVDLICSVNKSGEFDGEFDASALSASRQSMVKYGAAFACLGNPESRARMLVALTSPRDGDVQMAQVYLRHRPITGATEFRDVANGVARMPRSGAQLRTLDTLARQHISDRASLDELARLFPVAETVGVQRAIAGIFIRANYADLDRVALVHILTDSRLKSPDGNDLIDVLIRRLQLP
jgi:hypothetical protein